MWHRTLSALLLVAVSATARAETFRTGIYRGHPVVYAASHGRAVFQGDILLDHLAPPPAPGRALQPSVGVAYTQYLWPRNTQGVAEIPYTITTAATQLNAAINAFNTTFTGVIQLVPLGSQANYVNFDFDTGNTSGQCESYVGRIGGEQDVGGSGACSLGTLLHEMGHVVGLYHEQSRPDRDSYITINTNNLILGSESNFNQLGDNYQDLTLFDYASVMEYIPYAFSRNGGDVIESIPPGIPLSSLASYSAGDIDGVERLYGAAPKNVTVTSNPPGLAVLVDGNTITTPQSFAWKLKSTHTLAVASNAQALSGTTYIYGRWNDSTAASHGITVTAGNNTLAAPKTAPAVTVYTANFVQLAAYTGDAAPAAAGSVSVSPAPLSYSGASGSYFVARQAVTLTPAATTGYKFLTWGGTSAPFSADPKPDLVPDNGSPYAVTAYFSDKPITTITTVPSGLYFTLDGYYYQGPQNFASDFFPNWTAGSTHTLTGFSPNQPYSLNTRYVFDTWSDGGGLSHTITVAKKASTLTGKWTAQYVPIVYATPDCAGTVTLSPASSDGFYNSGTKVAVTEAAATGWTLTGWSGNLKGKIPTQTLTVTDEELAIATYDTSGVALVLTRLQPDVFAAGSAGGTVHIKGKGFTTGSIVFVNNAYRASTYVSATDIDVAVTSTDIATAGARPIGVSNFPGGADCSSYAALTFFVAK